MADSGIGDDQSSSSNDRTSMPIRREEVMDDAPVMGSSIAPVSSDVSPVLVDPVVTETSIAGVDVKDDRTAEEVVRPAMAEAQEFENLGEISLVASEKVAGVDQGMIREGLGTDELVEGGGSATHEPESATAEERGMAMEVDRLVGDIATQSGSTPVDTGVSGTGTPIADVEMNVAGIGVSVESRALRRDLGKEVMVPPKVQSAV